MNENKGKNPKTFLKRLLTGVLALGLLFGDLGGAPGLGSEEVSGAAYNYTNDGLTDTYYTVEPGQVLTSANYNKSATPVDAQGNIPFDSAATSKNLQVYVGTDVSNTTGASIVYSDTDSGVNKMYALTKTSGNGTTVNLGTTVTNSGDESIAFKAVPTQAFIFKWNGTNPGATYYLVNPADDEVQASTGAALAAKDPRLQVASDENSDLGDTLYLPTTGDWQLLITYPTQTTNKLYVNGVVAPSEVYGGASAKKESITLDYQPLAGTITTLQFGASGATKKTLNVYDRDGAPGFEWAVSNSTTTTGWNNWDWQPANTATGASIQVSTLANNFAFVRWELREGVTTIAEPASLGGGTEVNFTSGEVASDGFGYAYVTPQNITADTKDDLVISSNVNMKIVADSATTAAGTPYYFFASDNAGAPDTETPATNWKNTVTTTATALKEKKTAATANLAYNNGRAGTQCGTLHLLLQNPTKDNDTVEKVTNVKITDREGNELLNDTVDFAGLKSKVFSYPFDDDGNEGIAFGAWKGDYLVSITTKVNPQTVTLINGAEATITYTTDGKTPDQNTTDSLADANSKAISVDNDATLKVYVPADDDYEKDVDVNVYNEKGEKVEEKSGTIGAIDTDRVFTVSGIKESLTVKVERVDYSEQTVTFNNTYGSGPRYFVTSADNIAEGDAEAALMTQGDFSRNVTGGQEYPIPAGNSTLTYNATRDVYVYLPADSLNKISITSDATLEKEAEDATNEDADGKWYRVGKSATLVTISEAEAKKVTFEINNADELSNLTYHVFNGVEEVDTGVLEGSSLTKKTVEVEAGSYVSFTYDEPKDKTVYLDYLTWNKGAGRYDYLLHDNSIDTEKNRILLKEGYYVGQTIYADGQVFDFTAKSDIKTFSFDGENFTTKDLTQNEVFYRVYDGFAGAVEDDSLANGGTYVGGGRVPFNETLSIAVPENGFIQFALYNKNGLRGYDLSAASYYLDGSTTKAGDLVGVEASNTWGDGTTNSLNYWMYSYDTANGVSSGLTGAAIADAESVQVKFTKTQRDLTVNAYTLENHAQGGGITTNAGGTVKTGEEYKFTAALTSGTYEQNYKLSVYYSVDGKAMGELTAVDGTYTIPAEYTVGEINIYMDAVGVDQYVTVSHAIDDLTVGYRWYAGDATHEDWDVTGWSLPSAWSDAAPTGWYSAYTQLTTQTGYTFTVPYGAKVELYTYKKGWTITGTVDMGELKDQGTDNSNTNYLMYTNPITEKATFKLAAEAQKFNVYFLIPEGDNSLDPDHFILSDLKDLGGSDNKTTAAGVTGTGTIINDPDQDIAQVITGAALNVIPNDATAGKPYYVKAKVDETVRHGDDSADTYWKKTDKYGPLKAWYFNASDHYWVDGDESYELTSLSVGSDGVITIPATAITEDVFVVLEAPNKNYAVSAKNEGTLDTKATVTLADGQTKAVDNNWVSKINDADRSKDYTFSIELKKDDTGVTYTVDYTGGIAITYVHYDGDKDGTPDSVPFTYNASTGKVTIAKEDLLDDFEIVVTPVESYGNGKITFDKSAKGSNSTLVATVNGVKKAELTKTKAIDTASGLKTGDELVVTITTTGKYLAALSNTSNGFGVPYTTQLTPKADPVFTTTKSGDTYTTTATWTMEVLPAAEGTMNEKCYVAESEAKAVTVNVTGDKYRLLDGATWSADATNDVFDFDDKDLNTASGDSFLVEKGADVSLGYPDFTGCYINYDGVEDGNHDGDGNWYVSPTVRKDGKLDDSKVNKFAAANNSGFGTVLVADADLDIDLEVVNNEATFTTVGATKHTTFTVATDEETAANRSYLLGDTNYLGYYNEDTTIPYGGTADAGDLAWPWYVIGSGTSYTAFGEAGYVKVVATADLGYKPILSIENTDVYGNVITSAPLSLWDNLVSTNGYYYYYIPIRTREDAEAIPALYANSIIIGGNTKVTFGESGNEVTVFTIFDQDAVSVSAADGNRTVYPDNNQPDGDLFTTHFQCYAAQRGTTLNLTAKGLDGNTISSIRVYDGYSYRSIDSFKEYVTAEGATVTAAIPITETSPATGVLTVVVDTLDSATLNDIVEVGGDVAEGTNPNFTLEVGRTYDLSASYKGANAPIKEVKVNETGTGIPTAADFTINGTSVIFTSKLAYAGSSFSVTLVGKDEEVGEIGTYNITINKAVDKIELPESEEITGDAATGYKTSVEVGTQVQYALNAGEGSAKNLVVKNDNPNLVNAYVDKEGNLVIKMISSTTAAQTVAIYADENPRDGIYGSSEVGVSLTITPVASRINGATAPTVVLADSDNVSLKFDLALGEETAALFNSGKMITTDDEDSTEYASLWYRLTVKPGAANGASLDNTEKTYYIPVIGESQSTDWITALWALDGSAVPANSDLAALAKKFTVTADVVLFYNADINAKTPIGTNLATTAKSAGLEVTTKDAYYATSIKLGAKKATIYTNSKDDEKYADGAVIATVTLDGNATVVSDELFRIEDVTNDLGGYADLTDNLVVTNYDGKLTLMLNRKGVEKFNSIYAAKETRTIRVYAPAKNDETSYAPYAEINLNIVNRVGYAKLAGELADAEDNGFSIGNKTVVKAKKKAASVTVKPVYDGLTTAKNNSLVWTINNVLDYETSAAQIEGGVKISNKGKVTIPKSYTVADTENGDTFFVFATSKYNLDVVACSAVTVRSTKVTTGKEVLVAANGEVLADSTANKKKAAKLTADQLLGAKVWFLSETAPDQAIYSEDVLQSYSVGAVEGLDYTIASSKKKIAKVVNGNEIELLKAGSFNLTAKPGDGGAKKVIKVTVKKTKLGKKYQYALGTVEEINGVLTPINYTTKDNNVLSVAFSSNFAFELAALQVNKEDDTDVSILPASMNYKVTVPKKWKKKGVTAQLDRTTGIITVKSTVDTFQLKVGNKTVKVINSYYADVTGTVTAKVDSTTNVLYAGTGAEQALKLNLTPKGDTVIPDGTAVEIYDLDQCVIANGTVTANVAEMTLYTSLATKGKKTLKADLYNASTGAAVTQPFTVTLNLKALPKVALAKTYKITTADTEVAITASKGTLPEIFTITGVKNKNISGTYNNFTNHFYVDNGVVKTKSLSTTIDAKDLTGMIEYTLGDGKLQYAEVTITVTAPAAS